MDNRVPAQAFPAWETLQEELTERGLTSKDLATILGRSVEVAEQILTGRRPIGITTARKLEAAWGVSADFWLNLQQRYQWFLAEKGKQK